mmetsp:Transcript_14382/g.36421  ORF Transcript_14382/g.36421 Transcript_14382/m.36421 type:complete len:272 (+) Transcript_14382:908-1723(+)
MAVAMAMAVAALEARVVAGGTSLLHLSCGSLHFVQNLLGLLFSLALLLETRAPQLGVCPLLGEQLRVAALFDHAAVVQHDDLLGVLDGGEAMRDHHCGALDREGVERRLHGAFGDAVQSRGSFVEEHERRVLEQAAGDGHPLLFAAGQLEAAFADHGVEAFRERLDEAEDLRALASALDIFVRGVLVAVRHVMANGVVEEHGVLRDHTNCVTQRLLRDMLYILVGYEHLANDGVVEAEEEARDGALACPGGANDRSGGPRCHCERHGVEPT